MRIYLIKLMLRLEPVYQSNQQNLYSIIIPHGMSAMRYYY